MKSSKTTNAAGRIFFPRWLPLAASLTLMIMVAFLAEINSRSLNKAIRWRRHSIRVIFTAQMFQNNFLDAQRGVRGYVTLGDTNALASFQNAVALEPQQFKQLAALTADNPIQRQRLKTLAVAVADAFSFDNRSISIYRQQGFAGISKLDATGESRILFGNASDDLKAFSDEEQKLLDVRDSAEQKEYHDAGQLLVTGSALAAILLLLSSYLASREMGQRRRAEAAREKLIVELQGTLAHIKMLSGLIPICAWCKSVRSDTGYWQTVEHYVRDHSEARFSHGVCPACAEKFKDEIFRASQTAEIALAKK